MNLLITNARVIDLLPSELHHFSPAATTTSL